MPLWHDLGKDKYCPFSEEEEENMKTTMRLIPIIFTCAMIQLPVHIRASQQHHMRAKHNSILGCLSRDQANFSLRWLHLEFYYIISL